MTLERQIQNLFCAINRVIIFITKARLIRSLNFFKRLFHKRDRPLLLRDAIRAAKYILKIAAQEKTFERTPTNNLLVAKC